MTNVTPRRQGGRTLLFFSILIPVAFLAITYFSCKKDNCTYVHCLNGGTCNNGVCSCAPGYTGDTCQNYAASYIQYHNDASTPIVITVNGYTQTIPVGGNVTFAGNYSDSALGTATTVGTGATGGTLGETVTWTIANAFAVSTQIIPLDVSAAYFYLKVVDSGSASLIRLMANPAIATETANVTLPNNGSAYGIGYFYAYSNSSVSAVYSDGHSYSDTTLGLPMTTNQSFTFVSH